MAKNKDTKDTENSKINIKQQLYDVIQDGTLSIEELRGKIQTIASQLKD